MVTREELETALKKNGWKLTVSTSSNFSYRKGKVNISWTWATIYIEGENGGFTTNSRVVKLGKTILTTNTDDRISVKVNL